MNPLVLIVDDDKLLRVMVADALSAIPCRIQMAQSGSEAVAAIENEPPALVLLDLLMPEKSGLEVLRQFGKNTTFKIIVLSSIDAESLIDEAMKLGAVGFVPKPFHPLDVQNVVRAALESWSPRQ